MACKTSYELHHHFPKIAEESGFTFNTHRPRIRMDWNKIKLIDVDNLVKERKFIIIEHHLNDILDCVLESEFDVRILDEGVIKLFRLAQLAVEYQQFCRHYLDRSVYVLRQEITSLAQELDITKKSLHEKEEELRKLRKLTKHTQKYALPYGNDNIATMILKTLSTKGVMLPTSANADIYQYNKCNECGKVFLNQLYLQSHMSRRHQNITEIPQKETQINDENNESIKLNSEIAVLRNKLKEMETLITNTTQHIFSTNTTQQNLVTTGQDETNCENFHHIKKNMKDAEVSTNSESYLLDKIEEWKKVEREEHNKEINNLRNQITEIVNSFKHKEQKEYTEKDSKVIEQFHATIIQQGAEILALKRELDNAKVNAANDNSNRSQEADAQISLWAKRIENQSKQYESLLQKLNEVAKDAKESRALAIAEKERVAQLQILLERNFNNVTENTNHSTDAGEKSPEVYAKQIVQQKPTTKVLYRRNLTENQTIESLHRKAQELLNIGASSSSSSDLSSTDSKKPTIKLIAMKNERKTNAKLQDLNQNDKEGRSEILNKPQTQTKDIPNSMRRKSKEQKNRDMRRVKTNIEQKSITGSPIRVVRAKLTEEVNNQLVALGIDPLKCRLPQDIFQNHRTQLQQLRDVKFKKNPKHEKLRHAILAHLDTSTVNPEKEETYTQDYVLSNKVKKPLQNITSVLSGVKSKALSLVKLHDTQFKSKSGVAKQALSLLNTPSGSASNSPQRNIVPKINTNSVNETQENSNILNSKRKLSFDVNRISKSKNSMINKQHVQIVNSKSESSIESDQYESEHMPQKLSKSIENLIKSPARRPPSSNSDYKQSVKKYVTDETNNFISTQSIANSNDIINESIPITKVLSVNNLKDIDDLRSSSAANLNKATSEENILKQTKGVLKNTSSTSNLNKKKVIFDMDAIQMKSLSTSPSQSITEKSNSPHNYELGLDNLDDEEWDISSIENEPLKNDTKLQFRNTASPKIAELKKVIESQLARRVSSTGLVGAVDVLGLGVPVSKAASVGGSNTSLGSSILDESEAMPTTSRKAFESPKKIKDDSDLDTSNFSLDEINKSDKNSTF